MGWENAFDGNVELFPVEEWSIRELKCKDDSGTDFKCIGVYIKTRDGKEQRFALHGNQPIAWLEALIAVTGATLAPATPASGPVN